MGARRVLSDDMWGRLEPLLPDRTPKRGGQWTDHRDVVEAIIWRFRTGSPWRDLPEEFPPFQTVWWRFDRWSEDGTWDEVLQVLQGQAQEAGELDWTVSADSTVARATPRGTHGGLRTANGAGSRLTMSWAAPGAA
jgi:transposase